MILSSLPGLVHLLVKWPNTEVLGLSPERLQGRIREQVLYTSVFNDVTFLTIQRGGA